jgi:putative tryptophan/tyrosine transport system substrate-binding protein
MRRRDFISIFGSAAVWPFTATAQTAGVPTIGLLGIRTAEFDAPLLADFIRGMRESGFVEGRDVKIEYRWAGGQFDRLPSFAEELVRRNVALIVTFGGTAATLAAKAASSTIPIVFSVGDDPVRSGLVSSLSRPGGKITGATNFYNELAAKQLDLLHRLLPTVTVFAMLANPNEVAAESEINDAESAARSKGLQLRVIRASTEREIDNAFATFAQHHAGAILVASNPYYAVRANQLVALAARYALPTMFWRRELPEAGGLMSYGASPTEIYHQIGSYAARILKGEQAGDLPVIQVTKIEFVINLKTAQALHLDIPPTLLALADEVIE